jgi:hypothetical protein
MIIKNVKDVAERVNLKMLLVSVLIAAIGLALIVLSEPISTYGYHKIGSVVREWGVLMFASVAIAVLWDVAGKRAFADEILAKANMSRDLADAGIDIVTKSFQDRRISWDDLFKNACKLDMFVAYAHTWRNTNIERMDSMLSDKDSRIRIILPDAADEDIVRLLALRFETQPANVKRDIYAAKEFFEHRKKRAKGTVEIYFMSVIPLFSFYRFNNKVVFALYNHRAGRLPVPTFVADEEGFLFKYFTDEFEGMIADARLTQQKAPDEIR